MSCRTSAPYDVVVIGAGIVGAAIARALSGLELDVALLEKRDDVGEGTSKANTAILHTGFDATPGTLEARLVARGYSLLSDYARATGIPVEPTGAVLVAWTDEERDQLPALLGKARDNGYERSELIRHEEVYRRLPHLAEGVRAGMTVPDEHVTCTWTTNLALAIDATTRGADLLLNCEVVDIERLPDSTILTTSCGEVAARWVVNAAGLGSDHVDRMFGHDHLTVTPRRGELIVFDKLARRLCNQIVLPVPTSRTKGVLVAPTVYGNVLIGPTAEDLGTADTATSREGLRDLLAKGQGIMPELLDEEITASYAGLRAATEHSDYVVRVDADQRYALAGGIRSTGLTSGMAIAEHLLELLDDAGLSLRERTDLPDPPAMPNLGEAFTRPYEDPQAIAADPVYGHVVCFCERVTEGEIRDAYSTPIPPVTLAGLRRRTRVMNGRCQGFFCGAHVEALRATHQRTGMGSWT